MSSQKPSTPSTSTSSSSSQVATVTVNPNPSNTTGQSQTSDQLVGGSGGDPALSNFLETYLSLKKAFTEKEEEARMFSDNLGRCIEVNSDIRKENEGLKALVKELQDQVANFREQVDADLVSLGMVTTILQEDCQESEGALAILRQDKEHFEREVVNLRAQVRALTAVAEAAGGARGRDESEGVALAAVVRNPGAAHSSASSKITNAGNRGEVKKKALKEAYSQTEEISLGAAPGPSSPQDQATQCQIFMETDSRNMVLFKRGHSQQSQQGSQNVPNPIYGRSQPQVPLPNGHCVSALTAPADVPRNFQSQESMNQNGGVANGGVGQSQSLASISDSQVIKQETSLFPCALCGRNFIHFKQLNSHLQRRHFQPRIRCPFCVKLFQYQSTLENHIAVRHSVK